MLLTINLACSVTLSSPTLGPSPWNCLSPCLHQLQPDTLTTTKALLAPPAWTVMSPYPQGSPTCPSWHLPFSLPVLCPLRPASHTLNPTTQKTAGPPPAWLPARALAPSHNTITYTSGSHQPPPQPENRTLGIVPSPSRWELLQSRWWGRIVDSIPRPETPGPPFHLPQGAGRGESPNANHQRQLGPSYLPSGSRVTRSP